MSTKVGAGESKEQESFKAGVEAAQSAFSQAEMDKCDFVLMFATAGYNQEDLLKGVRSITGDAPLSGCSGEGLITQSGPEGEVIFSLSGSEKGIDAVGVMVFSSDEISFINLVEKGLKENSMKAGEETGKKINAAMTQNPLFLLMFPDGYTVNINNFFNGINKTLKTPLLFCGGLSAHNFPFSSHTYQYHNNQVFTDAASCILISGNVKMEIGVNHGCMPIGIEKTITKANGNTVYEIENKSTWEFFKQYLGEDVKELSIELRAFISIGEKLPEEMSTEYDKYIIRSPYSLNPDESINFATELPKGAKVQLVRRDEEKIFQGTKKMAEKLKSKLKDKKLMAVLHFDCAGRGKKFFGDKVKEKGIDVIQDVLGKDIPWLGFYCFGEIAPIKRVNYFHNQTVVLCVIYNDIQDH